MPTGRDGFLISLIPIVAILLGLMKPPDFGQYANLITIAGLAVTIYSYWKRRSLGSPFISGLITGFGVSITLLGLF